MEPGVEALATASAERRAEISSATVALTVASCLLATRYLISATWLGRMTAGPLHGFHGVYHTAWFMLTLPALFVVVRRTPGLELLPLRMLGAVVVGYAASVVAVVCTPALYFRDAARLPLDMYSGRLLPDTALGAALLLGWLESWLAVAFATLALALCTHRSAVANPRNTH